MPSKDPTEDDVIPRHRNVINPGTPVDQLGSGYPEINPLKEPLVDKNDKPVVPAPNIGKKDSPLYKKGETGNAGGRPATFQQPITKKMLRGSQQVILHALDMEANDVNFSDRLKAAFYCQDRVFGKATQNLNVQNESAESYASAMAALGEAISTHALVQYQEMEMKKMAIKEGKDPIEMIDVTPEEVDDK